jgi:RNA 2',3'-cyclic 3'-phosphodiesterase
VRLFIALPLPAEIASAAAALLPDLPGLRRVRPELLHITLAFLGHTADERVADVVAACTDAAADQAPFAVTLDRAGRFPESGAPRVVWLGMGEGAAESAGLAIAIRRALTARDLSFDAKPFRPHVTLARVTDDADRTTARAIAAAVERLPVPALRFRVEAVIPFESVLSPKGPRYTPRAVVRLGRIS